MHSQLQIWYGELVAARGLVSACPAPNLVSDPARGPSSWTGECLSSSKFGGWSSWGPFKYLKSSFKVPYNYPSTLKVVLLFFSKTRAVCGHFATMSFSYLFHLIFRCWVQNPGPGPKKTHGLGGVHTNFILVSHFLSLLFHVYIYIYIYICFSYIWVWWVSWETLWTAVCNSGLNALRT